jgi:hypothetical protein
MCLPHCELSHKRERDNIVLPGCEFDTALPKSGSHVAEYRGKYEMVRKRFSFCAPNLSEVGPVE